MTIATATVLIVDDEPQVCQLIEGLLTGQGFRCESAQTVGQARRRLLEARFDLVLLDVLIPGSSGLEVLDFIAQRRLPTRAVCMTGLPTEGWEERMLSAGAAAVMQKPFDIDTILSAIAHALADVAPAPRAQAAGQRRASPPPALPNGPRATSA